MKRSIFLFSLLLFTFLPVFSQQYKIDDVEYSIKGCGHWIFGCTQEYALANEVPVDKKTVFADEAAITAYITDLEIKLKNLRAFETIELSYEALPEQDQITPVKLTIKLNIARPTPTPNDAQTEAFDVFFQYKP